MVSATVNETRPVDHALVKRLQQEVESLKILLKRLMDQSAASANTTGVTGAIQSTQGLNLSASYTNLFSSGSQGVGLPNLSHSTTPNKLSKNNASFSTSGREDVNSLQSLEKALNVEQTHSQHLQQKNETLIRELEELTASHTHLTTQNEQLIHALNNSRNTQSAVGIKTANIPQISPTEASQILATHQQMAAQTDSLWTVVDGIQTVMKKFFKYLIEEEDMRDKISAVS
jgi:hypothetical protein